MYTRVCGNPESIGVVNIERSGIDEEGAEFMKEMSKPNHLTTCKRYELIFSFPRKFGDNYFLFALEEISNGPRNI